MNPMYTNSPEPIRPVDGGRVIIPTRYIIGRKNEQGDYDTYYASSIHGKPTFTYYPCIAMHYVNRTDAQAVADFIDNDQWEVIDLYPTMNREERLLHAIFNDDPIEF